MKPEARNLKLLISCLLVWILSACAAPTATPIMEPATTALPALTEQAQVSVKPPTAATPSASPNPTALAGRVRASVIAGSWYPDDPDELAAMVDGFLAEAEAVDGAPMALIVPHAGYAYSGPVAAYGFKQLEGKEYDVAIIIAADHQVPLSNSISVWAEGGFATPLGVVAVDEELAGALVAADPRITFDPAAHEGEHSIEIQLPFLQRVCPACRIVPVLMGTDDEESVEALANALLSALPGRRAVVIASSDLSHYPAYDDARTVDGTTLAAIETGDAPRVRETIAGLMGTGFSNLATCACGEGPILVAMRVAQGLGAETVSILRYANSGDAPFGDREQVVGYGAVMFWHYTPPDLTGTRREELLKLARTAIAEYLETGNIPDYETEDPVLTRRAGAFVTLRQGDELRGCIGRLWADKPLYRRVQEMAVAAATSDPRFPPLTAEELDNLTVEVSVLSPLRRVIDIRQIEVGTYGLVIIKAGRQGVLLPQVPVEEGWDREEFLGNLCLKAGLTPDCWTDQPALYAFTALVFGETE